MKFTSKMGDKGFSLIEIMIALLITMLVMASVFLLLQKGQTTFQREPEVADVNANARSGLDRISRELTVAGYNTPANMAVLWLDGGGINPDELTIVFADPDVPVSQPKPCGGGGGSARYVAPETNAPWLAKLQPLPELLALWQPALAPVLTRPEDVLSLQGRRGRRGGGRRGGRGGRGGGTGGGGTGGGGTGGGGTGGGGTGGGGTGGGGTGGGGTGGGPCNTIGTSAVLNIDPYSFEPQPVDFEQAYQDGMVLMAIQGPNGDPVCDAVPPGIIPFELTQPPKCTNAGGAGSGPAGCATLNLNHNPGQGATDLNPPGGFQRDVDPNCAVIGFFHVVQYRINPLPPAANPSLERRDLTLGEPWTPVAANIENLQVQYAQGVAQVFEDEPGLVPLGNDPNSWITRVRVTVAGRSESANLQGGSQGVFAAEDTHLRRTFTTTVSLRNQLGQAAEKAMELDLPGWN